MAPRSDHHSSHRRRSRSGQQQPEHGIFFLVKEGTAAPTPLTSDGVLSVHLGHSANCSSVGSVVDFLFLSSAAAATILTAIQLRLKNQERDSSPPPTPADSDDNQK